jgi:hypothetical protein
MAYFSLSETQRRIAERGLHQLPPDSSMVILPMDMEYMEAGKTMMTKKMLKEKSDNITPGWTETDYEDIFKYQMRELWEFTKNKKSTRPKDNYFPFVFIDARRVAQEGKEFFDYKIVNNKMVLKPCFLKTYLVDRKFCGIKIYPPLGYYPFDENLLPIWRYASENDIPITAHCSVSPIYYRGKKKKEWNFHPIFKEEYSKGNYEPKLLPQIKNSDFYENFTHPLNYLCLIEEDFLKMVISKTSKNSEVRELYGYSEADNTLKYNLSNLKICFAHFGGEDEWIKYLKQDGDSMSQWLIHNPDKPTNFMEYPDGDFPWYKINEYWDKTDWFSIICSMLIRYENIYADISFISSMQSIYPSLKYILEKGSNYKSEHKTYLADKRSTHYTGKNKLRSRVLFGTDFYMVRNQKSDKKLFTEIKAALSEDEFNLIAKENTYKFLQRS